MAGEIKCSKARKQIMQLIDTLIEAEQLKQKVNAGNTKP